MWVVHSQGFTSSLHYLDDFLFLGHPNSPRCKLLFSHHLCEELGVKVGNKKTEEPSTILTFLGIEIDTQRQELRLPQDKLTSLTALLDKWMRRFSTHTTPRLTGTKRDLVSLIGVLNHADSVVCPGRTFLRNLIEASTTVKHLNHNETLRTQARADIAWWHTFITTWNGTSTMPAAVPSHVIFSDASGSWGCGAFCEHSWFQIPWTGPWKEIHIAAKKFAPIIVAAAIWVEGRTRVLLLRQYSCHLCTQQRHEERSPIIAPLLFLSCHSIRTPCGRHSQHGSRRNIS